MNENNLLEMENNFIEFHSVNVSRVYILKHTLNFVVTTNWLSKHTTFDASRHKSISCAT